MHLRQAKVSNVQFYEFTDKLLVSLCSVQSLDELYKFKASIHRVWAQATNSHRIYRAEKISAEYSYLHQKFTDWKGSQL